MIDDKVTPVGGDEDSTVALLDLPGTGPGRRLSVRADLGGTGLLTGDPVLVDLLVSRDGVVREATGHPDVTAQLLVQPYLDHLPHLPEFRTGVTAAWGVALCLAAVRDTPGPLRWSVTVPGLGPMERAADQHVDAKTCTTSEGLVVVISGPALDLYQDRIHWASVRRPDRVPLAWREEVLAADAEERWGSTVELVEDGLAWRLPGLRAGDHVDAFCTVVLAAASSLDSSELAAAECAAELSADVTSSWMHELAGLNHVSGGARARGD